jgi:hypothetical protein
MTRRIHSAAMAKPPLILLVLVVSVVSVQVQRKNSVQQGQESGARRQPLKCVNVGVKVTVEKAKQGKHKKLGETEGIRKEGNQ